MVIVTFPAFPPLPVRLWHMVVAVGVLAGGGWPMVIVFVVPPCVLAREHGTVTIVRALPCIRFWATRTRPPSRILILVVVVARWIH